MFSGGCDADAHLLESFDCREALAFNEVVVDTD